MITRLTNRPARIAGVLFGVGLAGAWGGTVLAAAAAQPAEDPTSWPLIAALLSLLAIPVVASGVTALLLRISGTGIPAETVVWLVCFAAVAVAYFAAGGAVPLIDPANPVLTSGAWLGLLAGFERATKAVYDVLLRRVWPAPTPA